MFNYVIENIIEITMVYVKLSMEGKIYTEDSMEGKLTIYDLSEEFEKVHKDTDWGEIDYLEEIENFAKEKLVERFGKQEEIHMDKFAIKIKETLARTVIVEAENIDEAIQKVTDAYEAGRIILDSDDYDNVAIDPSEYFREGKVTNEDVSYYWHLEE